MRAPVRKAGARESLAGARLGVHGGLGVRGLCAWRAAAPHSTPRKHGIHYLNSVQLGVAGPLASCTACVPRLESMTRRDMRGPTGTRAALVGRQLACASQCLWKA
jgi:hypothetical protein